MKNPSIIRVTMIYGDTRDYYWSHYFDGEYVETAFKKYIEKREPNAVEEIEMLFFGGYKDAIQQYQEFLWQEIKWWNFTELMRRNIHGIISVEISDFIPGFGGMKWRNGKTWKELTFKYPDDFHFYYHKGINQKVRELYKIRLRGLE